MTKLKLEMWIDYEEKIISFMRVIGWFHQSFKSEKDMLEQLELFTIQGFHFQ